MQFSKSRKFIPIVIVGIILVSTPIILMMLGSGPSGDAEPPEEIKITFLLVAGVMIEAKGLRIYIDPYLIPDNYTELPADIILITHPHQDHYSLLDIRDIENENTTFIMPENMTEQVERHDAIAVNPGDSLTVDGVNITAFYLYTDDRPSIPSNHPPEANYTSYIIDIDGFKIFHAGDAKNMTEYEDLSDTFDVAFLPIYYDPAMGDIHASLSPIAEVVETIRPRHIVPTHWNAFANSTFILNYSSQIESLGCTILNLAFFESVIFTMDGNILQSVCWSSDGTLVSYRLE